MHRALLILALSSCGGLPLPGTPQPGHSCSATEAECISTSEVAYCEAGTWAAYTCRTECRNAQTPRCSWNSAEVGDTCPAALEGSALCHSSSVMFRCLKGRFTAASCANACTQTSSRVACT